MRAPPNATPATTTREEHRPRRVLLVEDDADDAALQARRLAEGDAHFDVDLAGSVSEALAALSLASHDIVILDLGLPDTSGVDGVRRIRQARRDVPIVVVTGASDPELHARALVAGADEAYTKAESNSRLFWRSVLQISEHKRALHQQLCTLIDAMPEGALVVGRDATVRHVNPAALRLFDRPPGGLVGEPLHFPVFGDVPREIVIPHAGTERVCELHVLPLTWLGELARLATLRDVTPVHRLGALEAENHRIAKDSRTKSAFLANMSHELRTPLNAIIGFAQLIVEGQVDPLSPKLQRFAGHILTSGQHLLTLINDVLDLAKVEAGKISFRPVAVDLSTLVHEVVDVLGALAREKNIRIETLLDDAPARLSIDPVRLKQVLYNYLSNALKFAPAGGRVTLSVIDLRDGRMRVSVSDDGAGIAAEDLPRLFTEFTQMDGGAVSHQQGTGLGLALTRRLVEAQGGSVAVESRLGAGSTFSALLPCVHGESPVGA